MLKDEKNKKENKRFFKDFKAELKKVIWPTPKQLVNNTVAVITIVLITALIVLVLDSAFKVMNTYGINKIKEAVESRNEVSEEGSIEKNENDEITEEQTENEQSNSQEETQNENTVEASKEENAE